MSVGATTEKGRGNHQLPRLILASENLKRRSTPRGVVALEDFEWEDDGESIDVEMDE